MTNCIKRIRLTRMFLAVVYHVNIYQAIRKYSVLQFHVWDAYMHANLIWYPFNLALNLPLKRLTNAQETQKKLYTLRSFQYAHTENNYDILSIILTSCISRAIRHNHKSIRAFKHNQGESIGDSYLHFALNREQKWKR